MVGKGFLGKLHVAIYLLVANYDNK